MSDNAPQNEDSEGMELSNACGGRGSSLASELTSKSELPPPPPLSDSSSDPFAPAESKSEAVGTAVRSGSERDGRGDVQNPCGVVETGVAHIKPQ